jgi:hypothetical protein
LITPCIIQGCVWGCQCCDYHEWDVELYMRCNDGDTLLYCLRICNYGWFEFEVPYEGCYFLKVCMSKDCCKTSRCKPIITLTNVGVEKFMIE